MAYENMVEEAKLGETIKEGGFIKTSLIDVDNIIVNNSIIVGGSNINDLDTRGSTFLDNGGFKQGSHNNFVWRVNSTESSGSRFKLGEFTIGTNYTQIGFQGVFNANSSANHSEQYIECVVRRHEDASNITSEISRSTIENPFRRANIELWKNDSNPSNVVLVVNFTETTQSFFGRGDFVCRRGETEFIQSSTSASSFTSFSTSGYTQLPLSNCVIKQDSGEAYVGDKKSIVEDDSITSLIGRFASNISSVSGRRWAQETGADITSNHTAYNSDGAGDLSSGAALKIYGNVEVQSAGDIDFYASNMNHIGRIRSKSITVVGISYTSLSFEAGSAANIEGNVIRLRGSVYANDNFTATGGNISIGSSSNNFTLYIWNGESQSYDSFPGCYIS